MLPDDQKSLIKETVENFAAYKKVRKALAQDGSSGVRFMGDPRFLDRLCDNVVDVRMLDKCDTVG